MHGVFQLNTSFKASVLPFLCGMHPLPFGGQRVAKPLLITVTLTLVSSVSHMSLYTNLTFLVLIRGLWMLQPAREIMYPASAMALNVIATWICVTLRFFQNWHRVSLPRWHSR